MTNQEIIDFLVDGCIAMLDESNRITLDENTINSYLLSVQWAEELDDYEFAPETEKRLVDDLTKFLSSRHGQYTLDNYLMEKVVHDFHLTRNRYGAGFWDGDYPTWLGDYLTRESHKFPEIEFYVGDDGLIYCL